MTEPGTSKSSTTKVCQETEMDTDIKISRLGVKNLVKIAPSILLMLNPIVPHVSHALWPILGGEGDILDARWPQTDENALTRDSIEMVVQVNGKVRAKMDVPAAADKDTVEALARSQPNVARFLDGLNVRKVIVVPGKLVNIVANSN